MMGPDHALHGALNGLGAIELVSLLSEHPLSPQAHLVGAAIVAGAVLLPDWDHPKATAAQTFGPFSRGIAHLLNRFGEWVFALTATRYDRPRTDGHRLITHTTPFAIAVGALVWAGAQFGHLWALVGITFLCMGLMLRGLAGKWVRRNGWLVTTVSAAVLAWVSARFVPEIDPAALGWLVALGCWTHCLGDSCTLAGCPWLWPLKIKGQRWYPIGTPQFLRFRTGTEEFDGEDRLRWVFYLGLAVLALALPLSMTSLWPWPGRMP